MGLVDRLPTNCLSRVTDRRSASRGHPLVPFPGVSSLEADPLHLVQTDFVVSPVIQLRGARRRVVRHRCGVLQHATVFQVRGDAGRAERVVADGRADARSNSTAPDHRIGVRLRQRRVAELAGATPDRAEQRSLDVIRNAGALRYASSVW